MCLVATVQTIAGCLSCRPNSPAQSVRDVKSGVFLLNSRHSNSGMNLPRRALAEIAGGRPFFSQVIETGSQPGNLDRIARGEADATAVDCVTYAFWRQYRPAAAERVRVVAQTPPSPAIPFVTSADTPAATVGLRTRRAARAGTESTLCERTRRPTDCGHCRT